MTTLDPTTSQLEVDACTAAELASTTGHVLLDVREDEEWERGHAPDARHRRLGLILPEAGGDPDALPGVARDATILVVCRSGRRSQRACAALTAAGWAVRNVTGGMLAWAEADLPVLDIDGQPGVV